MLLKSDNIFYYLTPRETTPYAEVTSSNLSLRSITYTKKKKAFSTTESWFKCYNLTSYWYLFVAYAIDMAVSILTTCTFYLFYGSLYKFLF